MGIRLFAAVNGIYDDGLLPATLDTTGKIPTVRGLYGVEVSLGAYGSKSWRRSNLGLDYRGAYRQYANNTFLSGTDQFVEIGFSTQVTKRFRYSLKGRGGTTSSGLGTFGAVGIADAPAGVGSTALLFNNPTSSAQGGADFVYQKSARLSFSAGGDAYTVRRRSNALVGVNGYLLRGSTTYQHSKPLAISLNYSYTHYDFPRAFGESDVNTLQAGIERKLGRRWTLGLSAGAFQAKTQGLQRVGVDPLIAALLGTSSVIQAFYRETILPSYTMNLTRAFRLSSISFDAGRAVNPGNGVFLTSQSETYGASYSYTGLQKASFGASVGYSKLGSIGQTLAGYAQYTGGVNASYRLFRFTQATARYDYRQSQIDLAGFKRTANRITFGVTFSPSEVPISWF